MKNCIVSPILLTFLSTVLPAQRPVAQSPYLPFRSSREFQNTTARVRRDPAVHQLERPGCAERLVRDLDRLAANGIFIVNVSPGRGEPKYLSPEHMSLVKFVSRKPRSAE